ncbi:HEAT repeat domain-containing protein [Actinophytocola sp.]|uniref:HEAT repeat domain-containing protein n=1 Tax=Actinophytocola sp. TaxID=1872138 RepID=UPI002EDB33C1
MADRRGVPNLKRFKGSAESYYRLHLEAVREQDFTRRVTASWGLIARGRESLPYLMSMLRSGDADSREDAGGALTWLGEDAAGLVGELLTALRRETDPQARDSIVATLGALRNRAAVPALAALIRSADTDGDTRRCAVESLGTIVRRRFDKQPDPEAAAIAWLDAHPG